MVTAEVQTDEAHRQGSSPPESPGEAETARKKPKEEEMNNGYMWLRLGKERAADLRKEMEEHRLASHFQPPSWVAARVLASVWLVALGAVVFLLGQ
jgi:hypothetical protein